MYIDKPLHEYLDDLAARKAAPGGGSAAALAASIGASLMSMVANYTVGNPKYKEVEGKIADILSKVDSARGNLQALIDKDVKIYDKLSRGMKETKRISLEQGDLYKEAAEVPFEICKITSDCLRMCRDLAKGGNTNLITDTAIAAILLEGAFFSAKFNVYINLKYIKEMDYVGRIHTVISALEEDMPKLKEEILEICEDAIAK